MKPVLNIKYSERGDDVDDFEKLLDAERVSVERLVRFRVNSKADADDVLQEVYLTAFRNFPQLKSKDAFKAWIISIARNKCSDYFRRKAAQFEIQCFHDGVASEQYLDKDGRTILWRRFNRDDWAMERFQKRWSEQLPDNEQLIINGITYVHWYDCITDYIL